MLPVGKSTPRKSAGMSEQNAVALFDALHDIGFRGGFDLSCFCMDGHYGWRAKKAGQPKSDRWCVAFTVYDDANPPTPEDGWRVVQEGTLTEYHKRDFPRGRTVWITGWAPKEES